MTTDSKAPASVEAAQPEALSLLRMRPASDLRRWAASGTGVGFELRENDLHIVVARVRPSKTMLPGAMRVSDFRTRPAAEWGREVTEFLKRHGAAHIAATVVLPRTDVIVRQLQLPGVANRDLQGAVQLQVDSLHPFADDEVYFSWARLGNTPSVLVGICRRAIVDQYATLLNEAGLKTGSFTFSAAVLYSAMRLITAPPPDGFVSTHPADGGIEVYGEGPARPLYSATLPVGPARAMSLGRSELRLDPAAPAVPLTAMLPRPAAFPQGLEPDSPDFGMFAVAYGTALASACPWLAIEGNLLPPERRKASSRVRLIPTFTLSAALVVLIVLWALQSTWADSRYLGVLQHEIKKFEPRARRVETIDKAILKARAQVHSLDDFKRRAKLDMDTIAEITKLIPPPGWVSNLDMDRSIVQIGGEIEQAAPLVQTFDESPLFRNSSFAMPISRNGAVEMFRVKSERETPPLHAPAAPARPATQPAAAAPKPGTEPKEPKK